MDGDQGPLQAGARKTRLFDDELFLRDLSEVHMLIDFVSGRADKSLADLEGIAFTDPGAAPGAPPVKLTAQQAVEEICKISYPPGGDIEVNAQQAAFMLMVKDKLNFLASPSRGLTVAFTSMFAGVSLRFDSLLSIFTDRLFSWCASIITGERWEANIPPNKIAAGEAAIPAGGAMGQDKKAASPDMRRIFYSARAAYPNLEAQARRFRSFYSRLPFFASAVVLAIVYINFDIGLTNGALQHISTAQAQYADLLSKAKGLPPNLANCAATATPPPDDCPEARLALDQIVSGRRELGRLMGGWPWLHPVPATVALLAPLVDEPSRGRTRGAVAGKAAPPDEAQYLESTPLENLAGDAINGLTTIIVPTAFGLLGTMAGLMRSITLKVRESLLSPRDLMVSRIGICLGMSAGLAVGLFSKQIAPVLAAGQVAGGVSVSTAGLSFLVGFGAEAFFTFLDGLLLRTFPTPQQLHGQAAKPTGR